MRQERCRIGNQRRFMCSFGQKKPLDPHGFMLDVWSLINRRYQMNFRHCFFPKATKHTIHSKSKQEGMQTMIRNWMFVSQCFCLFCHVHIIAEIETKTRRERGKRTIWPNPLLNGSITSFQRRRVREWGKDLSEVVENRLNVMSRNRRLLLLLLLCDPAASWISGTMVRWIVDHSRRRGASIGQMRIVSLYGKRKVWEKQRRGLLGQLTGRSISASRLADTQARFLKGKGELKVFFGRPSDGNEVECSSAACPLANVRRSDSDAEIWALDKRLAGSWSICGMWVVSSLLFGVGVGVGSGAKSHLEMETDDDEFSSSSLAGSLVEIVRRRETYSCECSSSSLVIVVGGFFVGTRCFTYIDRRFRPNFRRRPTRTGSFSVSADSSGGWVDLEQQTDEFRRRKRERDDVLSWVGFDFFENDLEFFVRLIELIVRIEEKWLENGRKTKKLFIERHPVPMLHFLICHDWFQKLNICLNHQRAIRFHR